jgi:hypothetical protein
LRNETTRKAADLAEEDMAGGSVGDFPGGDLQIPVGDGDSTRADLVGGGSGAASVKKETKGEYSPKPRKNRSLKIKDESSPRQNANENVVDLAAFKASVTIHPPAFFDDDIWKRSRIKKGWLIKRIAGYDPVEGEYGVHYLKVISRNPKRTSGDCSRYEHAGFSTWDTLQKVGRLVKERKRYERIAGDGANAS